ncbi:hypothetical protein O181_099688 [Austropuccinia psidii MF-1]|uniref:Uncharacterized protein n=1 Tax=Austropuccinia psidii MF-1 TaxID=1389203 RepID=A0A9Q3JBE8_9BASI|nr:hypothetical protein [Austropuccinia psidii MF-1]
MLKAVMNWMEKKLRWLIIQLANNPVLLLPASGQKIPSTPRNFQPALSAIPTSLPHSSPSSSHTRPAINPEVRPSPIVTSQQLQPDASSSRRREELSPSPFPAAQVFHQRDHCPIRVSQGLF